MTVTPYERSFDEETSKQCSGTCPECDGEIEIDGGEHTCRPCGLIIDGYGIAHHFEPRSFEDGPNRERTGAPLTNARYDDEGQPNTQALCKPISIHGDDRD